MFIMFNLRLSFLFVVTYCCLLVGVGRFAAGPTCGPLRGGTDRWAASRHGTDKVGRFAAGSGRSHDLIMVVFAVWTDARPAWDGVEP